MTEESRDPRRRILDVATEVFAEKGIAGARVDEIAERARVNKAMVYYHVGDKDLLYTTVLLETIGGAVTRLRAAVDSAPSPEARLRAVTRVVAAVVEDHPHFPTLMLREISSGGANLPDAVVGAMSAIFRTVADVVHEGVQKKDFRPVDPLITHMLMVGGMMVLLAGRPLRERIRQMSGGAFPPFPEPDPSLLPEQIADLVLGGILLPRKKTDDAERARAGRKKITRVPAKGRTK